MGLGDEILVAAHDGRQLRLRLVALLDRSIFQSEIMISEEAFERHFPDWSGYRFLLAEASTAGADAVVGALERGLGDYGLDATPSPMSAPMCPGVLSPSPSLPSSG